MNPPTANATTKAITTATIGTHPLSLGLPCSDGSGSASIASPHAPGMRKPCCLWRSRKSTQVDDDSLGPREGFFNSWLCVAARAARKPSTVGSRLEHGHQHESDAPRSAPGPAAGVFGQLAETGAVVGETSALADLSAWLSGPVIPR